jgi:hypothetical protein
MIGVPELFLTLGNNLTIGVLNTFERKNKISRVQKYFSAVYLSQREEINKNADRLA